MFLVKPVWHFQCKIHNVNPVVKIVDNDVVISYNQISLYIKVFYKGIKLIFLFELSKKYYKFIATIIAKIIIRKWESIYGTYQKQ